MSEAGRRMRHVERLDIFLECDLKAMKSEKDLGDLLQHHFGDKGHELRYAFGDEIGDLMLFFVMKPRQQK